MTWPGKEATLLPECIDALTVSLESVQSRAAWRDASLKAGLDHSRSYQVRFWHRAGSGGHQSPTVLTGSAEGIVKPAFALGGETAGN